MNKYNIDENLAKLKAEKENILPEFSNPEDFKQKFFERAKKSPPARRFGVPMKIAAMFAICAAIGLISWSVLHEVKEPEPPIKFQEVTQGDFEKFSFNYSWGYDTVPMELATSTTPMTLGTSAAPAPSLTRAKAINFMLNTEDVFPHPHPVVMNTEEYKFMRERGFFTVSDHPLNTFGADVDTASYANLRRMVLHEHRLPPRDAVRVEECLNYFTYNYNRPEGDEVFGTTFEFGVCPWNKEHRLLLVGLQSKTVADADLPAGNYVFLVDNSGSMYEEMPLVIESMKMLADRLRAQDKISLVTYGGGVKTLLDSVDGTRKHVVKSALDNLTSDGYTPGADGIQRAYALARKNFVPGGNNRVILITDGDFNVGVSSESELVEMIEKERQSLIYLTAIGVGAGNYKDNKMKMLANKGNGNYIYLDGIREARKALVEEVVGRTYAVARDVKFQLEFNPGQVHSYRRLGYEYRELDDSDFDDDAKDSGEVGANQQVTVLYELVMQDASDEVKKQASGVANECQKTDNSNICNLKIRYQSPDAKQPSVLREFPVAQMPSGKNLVWAAGVAEFAQVLRKSEFKGESDFEAIRIRLMEAYDGSEDHTEFLHILNQAKQLSQPQ